MAIGTVPATNPDHTPRHALAHGRPRVSPDRHALFSPRHGYNSLCSNPRDCVYRYLFLLLILCQALTTGDHVAGPSLRQATLESSVDQNVSALGVKTSNDLRED